ncbi:hypothetical protein [Rudaea sp.]|uniref:hypothetical protein n=1 Tax=Rudaea sp. TaxID=2136325 RepID=UPI0032209DC9
MKIQHNLTPIVFEPWKGKHYKKPAVFGKRVLVLGESHYDWESEKEKQIDQMPLDQKRSLTQRCIQGQIDGTESFKFWTNIAATFLGHLPNSAEKKSFWHSVAFYNYVQSIVGFWARKRPTKELWLEAQTPFVNVLNDLKPEVIIVLGFENWDNLPNLDGHAGPRIDGTRRGDIDTWHYPYSGGSCLAYRIRHPSSGAFSSKEWCPRVQRAISLA